MLSRVSSSIADNLTLVRTRIAAACARAGRRPDQVRLIAVTKGQPTSAVVEALAAGQLEFGENYVQELRAKVAELQAQPGREQQPRFHFIGHLQRNKVKDVVTLAHSIQTIDSFELAREIDKRSPAELDVMIEVNIAGEEQKAGVAADALSALVEQLRPLSKLRVRGLMTVPPAADEPEAARPWFQKLRALGADLAKRELLPASFELSMGMSADFEIAIEEGATMVRVGTTLFGARR